MSEASVTVRLQIYEIDGRVIESFPLPVMLVESHWNYSDRVVLVIDGHSYTLIAGDLREACDRARKL